MKTDHCLDRGFYITGWVLIVITILYKLFTYVTGLSIFRFLPPCLFHWLTGYYCPGCGGTRAVIALCSGHIMKSIYYHPFVPYVIVLGIWFMGSQTIERISGRKMKIGLHFRFVYLWIGLVLILGNFIIKNAVLFFTGTALLG